MELMIVFALICLLMGFVLACATAWHEIRTAVAVELRAEYIEMFERELESPPEYAFSTEELAVMTEADWVVISHRAYVLLEARAAAAGDEFTREEFAEGVRQLEDTVLTRPKDAS